MRVGDRLVRTRFRGCLVGHAVGDALGAAVEFLSQPEIVAAHGPHGLDDFESWVNDAGIRLPAGSITDDTQMSIATARGLLDACAQGSSATWHPAEPVWERYLDWLDSQNDPRERRFPGATCLSALRGGVPGEIDDPINDSKGTGGIMRIAPVGLAFAPHQAFEQGAEIAALTHGHPSGYLSAGFFAAVVSRLVRGADPGGRDWQSERGGPLPAAVAEMREILIGYDEHEEVLESIDAAVELYVSDADLDEGFGVLGEGWIAEEALGVALFCSLNFPDDFSEGVLAAVNITGDSDTTGCLTGALLGAVLGEDAVPSEWSSSVEEAVQVQQLADGLFDTFFAAPVE